MKYGFFIFHLLLLGCFTTLLYNARGEGKNKVLFHALFHIIGSTITLVLLKSKWRTNAEGIELICKSAVFPGFALIKGPNASSHGAGSR